MQSSLRFGVVTLALANLGFWATARPVDAAILTGPKVSVTLNFKPELLAQAKGLAVGAGLTLPAAVVIASPRVQLTGRGFVDTTANISTIVIDQTVAVKVRGITLSGKDCLIRTVSSITAVLSCVVEGSPLVPARRLPLIRFVGNPLPLSGGTAPMELSSELAAAVNAVAKQDILKPGLPLGTATGMAQR